MERGCCVVSCGVVEWSDWSGVVWCGVGWSSVEWSGVGVEWGGIGVGCSGAQGSAVECSAVEWSRVEWRGMAWRGVAWSGVAWSGGGVGFGVAQGFPGCCFYEDGAFVLLMTFSLRHKYFDRCCNDSVRVPGLRTPDIVPRSLLCIT